MQFIIPVSGNEARSRRQSTTLHIMIAAVLFCIGLAGEFLFWFTSVSPNFKSPYFPFALFGICCIIAAVCIVWLTIKNRQREKSLVLRVAELIILMAGAGLFYLKHWYRPAGMFLLLALLILFAIFWERRTGGQKRIIINEDGIEVPEAFKSYRWAEVESVLLRYNVLTIETIRNHIRQENVASNNDVDAGLMEAFARAQIEKALPERKKEW